jgi:two-component response regulator ARR-A family
MLQTKPYVLVAEDDNDDVDFFTSAFLATCPEIYVKHIADGASVLEFLSACPEDELPSLILLDYKMPLASAADVLRFLHGKEHFASMTKAVWSTSGRTTEIEECRALGAHDFFVKPASQEEWEELVSRLSQYFAAS